MYIKLICVCRGRVLYILVGFYPAHATPEEKLKTLDESIDKFRRALSLDSTKTDAHFNLGQALHMRSELLQDTTEIANSYTQSATGKMMTTHGDAYKVLIK